MIVVQFQSTKILERFHVLLRPNSLPLASLERDFGPTFVSMSRGNALDC